MKVYSEVSDYLDVEIQCQPAVMNSWARLRVCRLRMPNVYLQLLTDTLAPCQYDLFQFWEWEALWKHPSTLLPCLVHVAATLYPCCVIVKAPVGRVGVWVLRTHWEGCVITLQADALLRMLRKLPAPASPMKNLSVFSIPSCISQGLRIGSVCIALKFPRLMSSLNPWE